MEITNIKARVSINSHGISEACTGLVQELTDTVEYSFKDRASGFLALIRPLFFILTPINAASAAVLALRGYPSITKCFFGFFAVAFASCAVNVFNDYLDRERDKEIWPARPIPGGRVKPHEALLVVIISLAISLSITWMVFNPTAFSILLLAIILGGFYSFYLRKRVGYLSLPPIVGLIYLGGWAAFSPETLFSSVIPWYLYLLGVIWQAAHIMIYYPLHIIPDVNKKSAEKVPPALFFKPSPKIAVKIGVIFTCLTLLVSALLPFVAHLSAFYTIPVIAAGIYALVSGLKLLKSPLNKKQGIAAFKSLSIFRLVISAAILLFVCIGQN